VFVCLFELHPRQTLVRTNTSIQRSWSPNQEEEEKNPVLIFSQSVSNNLFQNSMENSFRYINRMYFSFHFWFHSLYMIGTA
jgi:hypothetical protein